MLKCFAIRTVSEEQDSANKSPCVMSFHTDQKVAFDVFLCCCGNCVKSPFRRTVSYYKSYPHW